ncbi:hypothetical protein ASE74_15890 [Pedobacter sp. Leaf216]|nr:hypothetical protein ASE74_15890 [Pedobacter sp. Leaf216]
MSLPMRITFENRDYTYSVLTKNINKDTVEFKISVQGEELTLVRSVNKEWDCPELTVGNNHNLLKAIGKSIALRYRL